MPEKRDHALLSASSSERWLNCPASPRYEEQFPAGSSTYADEGTLAHSICELYARKQFMGLDSKVFKTELETLKTNPLYDPEMLTTAEFYVSYLLEKSLEFQEAPYMALEVRLDFSEYVPDGFGTGDNVMIGGDTLHVTDYKHGKGVAVSPHNNSQMRFYALGALARYAALYNIKRVSMAICQPRLFETVEEDVLTVEELLAWGESVKPIAQLAYTGLGGFNPGDHCKFCRGKVHCRARANSFTALEDFKDFDIAGKLLPGDLPQHPNTLSDAEIGDLLTRGKSISDWISGLQEYAQATILAGGTIPGWKVVGGKSNRAFRDADAAIQTLMGAGYDKALLFDYKQKSMTELEKLVGKKDFAKLMGGNLYKPPGKPTLAAQSDKRPAYNSAVADFAGLEKSGA